ncbi:hypothetical protein HBI18_253770 [Parastagonospora nodorum]|nr:hypothetical protein HBI18_253770 [Parastagonospora nodorum]
MGAQQPGWERSSRDGSAAARMGAQQPGWERSSQDGSAAARMGAQQPGWERSSEGASITHIDNFVCRPHSCLPHARPISRSFFSMHISEFSMLLTLTRKHSHSSSAAPSMFTTSHRRGFGSTNVSSSGLYDQTVLENVVKGVVSIHFSHPFPFDTAEATSAQATGFVVKAKEGFILTNRHVVGAGPFTGYCVFNNDERCKVLPVYRDPVHDFGVLRFDTEKIRYMEVVALQLRPELAKVGADIRIVGNDAGEKLSILNGIISRVDRNAPNYGEGYSDFNTNYIQAATAASGGSSGSPVVNRDGFAVALQAGGRSDGAATDFFLPLDRVVRALEHLQRGEHVLQGTIQTQWSLEPFDECRRLGLSEDLEQDVREKFPTETGMLVAKVVLPQGPASTRIKVGDILVKINHELITQFVYLDSVLDNAVGNTISVTIQRGSANIEFELDVGNLHDITPDKFVSVAGAKFQALPYHQARLYNISLENAGVYVCAAAHSFISKAGCLIVRVENEPTLDLATFIEIMKKIPDRKRIVLQYAFPKTINETHRIIIPLDRHYTGWWDFKPVAEPLPAVQQVSTSAKFAKLNSRYPRANNINQSIVLVHVSMSISVDGFSASNKTGGGLVLDAEQGFVFVTRTTLPHRLCDVSLTIADSIIVVAKIFFMHPSHNYAIVQYDTSLVDAPVKTPEFSTELIGEGSETIFVGMDGSSKTVIAETVVTGIATYFLPRSTTPRYRATNFEGITVDTNLAESCGSGVLLSDDGIVQALWLAYSWHQGVKQHTYNFGFAARNLLPILARIRRNEKPELRILDAQFYATSIREARDMGVSEKWIEKIQQTESERHQLYMAKKVNSGEKNDIQDRDILLTLNGELIKSLSDLDVMYGSEFLDAVVVRQGQEVEIRVATIATKDLETDRIVCFCGATLQRPHHAVRQLMKQSPPSDVYVSSRAPGSPAELHNLETTSFITHINDVSTLNLTDMLTEITKIGCDYFRLSVVTLNGIMKVVTMKTNKLYFPTTEYTKVNGEALVYREISHDSEA